jgi:glycosyltransferase involved in cell wall biosynthesis
MLLEMVLIKTSRYSKMNFKVNISVVGRFHAFDLAKQMQKHKVLNKIITTYPKFFTKKWNIPSEKIVSELHLELLNRYKKYVPFISDDHINMWLKNQHDKNSIKYLDNIDVFIGWENVSLKTIVEAKKRGIITILEKGSAHKSFFIKSQIEEYHNKGQIYNTSYLSWGKDLVEYELADYISIPSSFVKKTFIDNGVPEEKLIVNPYGVDLQQFKQIKKDDNIFRVIYAGGLTFHKGSHYLLQAFSELNLPNSELWHLGSISNEMEPFIEQYSNENIKFLGHKPQNELYKYYSQGSVFVFPSLQDGFGMVILQAMACGLPLICTTNTGGGDLITKDGVEGFVIPVRDVNAIKEKILYLYNNPNICKEMGEKAKKRVENNFTWDDYGDRYIENLRGVLKK